MLNYWTQLEHMKLRTYWNVEHKTTSEIAKLMNRSIGSVIGRVHRLKNMKGRTEGQSPAQIVAPKKFSADGVVFEFDGGGKVFQYNTGCQWPTEETLFCGGEKIPKKPYCPVHLKRAYQSE